MIESYVASGDLAPVIYFNNGPGYNPFNAARWTFYNPGYYPTFEIDGLIEYVGFSIPTMQGHINSRLAVPSHLSITQAYSGDSYGGTVTYTLTAEQDLGSTGELKLWSAILEDHETASSGYGYYAGMELMWEPVAWPCGTAGHVVSFTGPYPQTVVVTKTYSLDPSSAIFSNLNGAAWVQMSSGTCEVMNASFADLPDTNTGISGNCSAGIGGANLDSWPNPCSGTATIVTALPHGAEGSVRIYDLHGRLLECFEAGGARVVDLPAVGVYVVRLESGSSLTLQRRLTVIP